MALFGSSRIEVLCLSDLLRDTENAVRRLCRFVQLDDSVKLDVEKTRRNSARRSPRLKAIIDLGKRAGLKHAIPRTALRYLGRKLEKFGGILYGRMATIRRFEADLRRHFRSDIDLLESLTERDFSRWK